MEKKYKFLPHTADVKFQAFGNTIEKAFSNSFLALKETIADKTTIKSKIEKTLKVKGNDLQSLLHNFLEEFLYLMEAEHFIASKIKDIKIDEKNLTMNATVLGDNTKNYTLPNKVKAITYNDILIEKNHKTWKTQIVLDT